MFANSIWVAWIGMELMAPSLTYCLPFLVGEYQIEDRKRVNDGDIFVYADTQYLEA